MKKWFMFWKNPDFWVAKEKLAEKIAKDKITLSKSGVYGQRYSSISSDHESLDTEKSILLRTTRFGSQQQQSNGLSYL